MNSYTKSLLLNLEKILDTHFCSPKLSSAFDAFGSAASVMPSRPLQDFLFLRGNENCSRELSPSQVQILMAGVAFRATSTYSAIPKLAISLQALGKFRLAGLLNENIKDELGGRSALSSHAEYLYLSFEVVGKAIGVNPLTPTSFLKLHSLMRDESREFHFSGEENSSAELVACEYLKLVNRCISRYHELVNAELVWPAVKPEDAFAHALELAVREASSVNEFSSPSFIGLYGKAIEKILDRLPSAESDRGKLWCEVHNNVDVHRGKSAEEEHAIDACNIAIHLLKATRPEQVLSAFELVSRLIRSRCDHWKFVSQAMQACASIQPTKG